MTDLPNDVEQLKAMLLQLQAENQAKDEQLKAKQEENTELQNKLDLLIEQLNLSKSKRFSASSEKVPKGTFNEAEQQQALTNAKSKTPSKPKGRKPLPAALERGIHEHKLDTPQCDCCKAPLHECGKEISEELKVIPQKVSVIRHERTKYACRQCEKTQTTTKVITAPKPASLLPKSIASADAMAAVVTAKYVDALPLYRQVDILKRSGIEICRATLSNWCVQLGDKVQRVIDAMQVQLKQESLICADETTVQVLREAGRDREQILAIQMGKAFQFDGVVILYSLLLRPYHEPSFPYQALRNY